MSYSSSDEAEEETFALHDAAEAGDAAALAQLLQGRLQQLEALHAAEQGLHALDDDGPPLPDDDPEVQARDYNECTPLHLAILNGSVACLELLIQARANIKSECDGCPPLHMAVCTATHAHRRAAAVEMVAVLLQAGADPFKRDDMGRTALHWAAALGLDQVCSALLDAATAPMGGNGVAAMDEGGESPPSLLELQDNSDDTPLHLAARFCHATTVQLLLHGPGAAAASSKNKAGQTPLHLAATHNAPAEVVTALLAASPSTATAANKKGLTAADLAKRRGHAALASLLQAHASKQDTSAASAPTTAPVSEQAASASSPITLVVAPAECNSHRTCPHPFIRGMGEPPPENVDRLSVLVAPGRGVLHGTEFEGLAWEQSAPAAAIADVLRVHDWPYVRRLQEECASVPDEPLAIGRLDADTAVSRESFKAALVAAGAVCMAVDRVLGGRARNAFCAVRPPGHHAGPRGIAPSAKDPTGSHGFCLLNNVAIGAAYAMNVYRHAGMQRVALLDFDVHHGNGTEACVSNTTPKTVRYAFSNALSEGLVVHHTYSPWRDVDDDKNVFFASVQGYGRKAPSTDVYVYPGSGATFDTAAIKAARTQQHEAAGGREQEPATNGTAAAESSSIEEDPEGEFAAAPPPDAPPADGPRIINVGIPGPGFHPLLWRRAWRDKILPALAKFDPDLILISAGFDAHRKDDINFRYVGVTEADYEWLTEQIVQVANRCCAGRVVSVLEGGYNLHGGVVSAFARSVAAHVRALAEPHSQAWDPLEGKVERELERKRREEKAAKAAARAAAIAAEEMRRAMSGANAGAALAAAAQAASMGDAGVAGVGASAAAEPGAEGASGDGAAGQQQAAAAVPPAVVPPAVVSSAAVAPAADAGRAKRRRMGAPVDYVALNAQMEAEAVGGRAESGAVQPAAQGPHNGEICTGATGKQGGATVDALLRRGLKVRALTRNTNSPKAQEIAARGCELAVADFDKPETLQAAFQGTDGVFCVTNYWEHMDPEREIRQATAMFDTAKAAGVQHIVWSGLEDTRPETAGKLTPPDGKYPVPHFDAKGVASEHLIKLGVPYSIVLTCAYMDNYMDLDSMKPQPIGQDTYGIFSNIGDKPLPLIATKDIGEVVAALLEQGPSKWAGKTVALACDYVKWPEIAKVLSDVTGKNVQGMTMSDEEFVGALQKAGVPEVAAKDLANMNAYYRDWSDSYLARHSVEGTKEVYPGVLSFKAWAEANKDALIKAMSG